MSSFFPAPASSSGTTSPFPALNLAVPTFDPSGRKRSIFDAGPIPNLAQPTNQTTMAPAASAAATAPPLFSFTSTTTSAPTTSGFGITATSAAPVTSSFLNLGQTTAQTTSGMTAASQPTSTFGQPPQQSTQTGPILQSTQSTADPAYFRSLLERQ